MHITEDHIRYGYMGLDGNWRPGLEGFVTEIVQKGELGEVHYETRSVKRDYIPDHENKKAPNLMPHKSAGRPRGNTSPDWPDEKMRNLNAMLAKSYNEQQLLENLSTGEELLRRNIARIRSGAWQP